MYFLRELCYFASVTIITKIAAFCFLWALKAFPVILRLFIQNVLFWKKKK